MHLRVGPRLLLDVQATRARRASIHARGRRLASEVRLPRRARLRCVRRRRNNLYRLPWADRRRHVAKYPAARSRPISQEPLARGGLAMPEGVSIVTAWGSSRRWTQGTAGFDDEPVTSDG